MKVLSINKYVNIGTTIRFLQDSNLTFEVYCEHGLIENIDRFLSHLEELEMNVTLRYSKELVDFKDRIEPDREVNRKLTSAECNEIQIIMEGIRKVFIAEAEGVFAFITTEKRFDITKLLDNIDKIFSPNTFQKLPEIAQYDFMEAGKCIAFERNTAAAFHLLRGTEDLLKVYYKKFMRTSPVNKVWGKMIIDLKGKLKGKLPDPVTLNHLDNIRNSFRNPTQHPDKKYDIQEVQDLLGVTIDVVNRMVKEIQ